MDKITIKFTKNHILGFLLLFFCVPNNTFSSRLRDIFNALFIIFFIFCLFMFYSNKALVDKRLKPIYLWISLIVISLVFNDVDIISNLRLIIIIFTTVLLVYNMMNNDYESGLKCIIYIYTFLAIIQLISVVTHCFGYTNDTYQNRFMYFFGIRVDIDGFHLFSNAIALLAFNVKSKGCRICSVILVGITTWFIIYEEVSTAIAATGVLWLVIIITKIRFDETLWKYFLIVIGIGAVFIVINYSYLNIFLFMLKSLFGKDATLSGRTQIWQQVISAMKSWHWLIGNGYGYKQKFRIGSLLYGRYVRATHSQYLTVLYTLGILGLITYFLILIKTIKETMIINDNKKYEKRVIFATLLSLLVMGISTSFIYEPYFYVFIVTALTIPKNIEYK